MSYLGDSLIFLISQPRAGSTMLQRIIGAHSDVQTTAEPWLMLYPVYALRKDRVTAEFSFQGFHIGLSDFLDNYAEGVDTYYEAVRAWASVLYGTVLKKVEKRYFLDKTPRYHLIISDLLRLFPEAKYIILLRNPLAVLYSLKQTFLEEDYSGLWYFRHDLLAGPVNLLAGIEALGDRCCVVHYEQLVGAPEEVVEEICDFLALRFSSEMLEYGNTPAPRGRLGDPTDVQKRIRPVTSSLDKWRQVAANEQDRQFALAYLSTLGPDVVAKMGYSYVELRQVLQSGEPTDKEFLVLWETLLKPPEEWTRQERLVVAKARAVQQSGKVLGTARFLRENALTLLRALVPV